MRLLKKKVNVFGKGIPVFAIVILSLALVSAALIGYFGSITGSVIVGQGLFLDGNNWNVPSQFVFDEFTSLEEKTFVSAHYLDNQADVDALVNLNTVCKFDDEEDAGSCDEITTSYAKVKPVAKDDNTNFGSSDNEAFGVDVSLTLNELFAGNGLQYEYTVLDGGNYAGASPVIAVITIEDGRHVILYPGYGGRTGIHTLEFSDMVATSTADSGDVAMDFTVYASDFQGGAQWSSNSEYGNWNYLKSSGSSTGGALPLTGIEVVTRVAIQHQAANAGQEDQIESILIGGISYVFEGGVIDNPVTVPTKETLDFVIVNHFPQMTYPGTYTITTTVEPVAE